MFVFVMGSPISYYLYLAAILYLPVIAFYWYNGTVFPGPLLAAPILFQTYIWAYQAVPPAVLFLAASRTESFELRYRLERGLHPYRVVCLLDPGLADPEMHGLFKRNTFEWDNLWATRISKWQTTVHPLMDMASFILVDARVGTPGVIEEISRIVAAGLFRKTLFIVDEAGNAAALEANAISTTSNEVKVIREEEAIPVLKAIGLSKTASPDELFRSRDTYTRVLTPNALSLARASESQRNLWFLRVICRYCNLSIEVPWEHLRDTDAMSPAERNSYVKSIDNYIYSCRGCGGLYFVIWHGTRITVERLRK